MQHWRAASCPVADDTMQVLGQAQSTCLATSAMAGCQAAAAQPMLSCFAATFGTSDSCDMHHEQRIVIV